MQPQHSSSLQQAVVGLVVPSGLIMVVTTEDLEIAGRRVAGAFLVVGVLLVVVLLVVDLLEEEVVTQALTNLVAATQTIMEDVAHAALAEGDRVVRLVSQVAGAEEEEAPPAIATMADDEAVEDAPT